MKKPKVLLFDYDGVLVDTHDLHYQAITEYFNVDLDVEQFKDMHNGNFYSHTHPKVLEGANWSGYGDYIQEIVKARVTIPEDRVAIVRTLAEHYPLFIISSGHEPAIAHTLERAEVFSSFQSVMGYETSTSKVEKMKLALEAVNSRPSEAVFVTDTLGDILECKEVGIGSIIAVTYGFHTREHLNEGEPDVIIDSFAELRSFV